MRMFKMMVVLVVAVFGLRTLEGRPISGEQAREAVATWVRLRGTAKPGVPISVQTLTDAASQAQIHAVRLSGGGCVFTAGDDRSMPIKAIIDEDAGEIDAGNPLVQILLADAVAEARANAPSAGTSQTAGKSGTTAGGTDDAYEEERAKAEQTWRRLLSGTTASLSVKGMTCAAATTTSTRKVVLDDTIIVPAILKTRWGQSTHNNKKDARLVGGTGIACYNSKCPEIAIAQNPGKTAGDADTEEVVQNVNALCGCVATAGAQLMKKWQCPGRFTWGSMKDDPSEDVDAACCEAIGILTRAVADTCVISWGLDATSANTATMVTNLKTTFGYASSEWTDEPSVTDDADGMSEFNRLVIPEIMKDRPVILSLHRGEEGHCVVADGYRILDNQHYLHINLGWNKGGGWYLPPKIKNYTSVEGVGHNIDPSVRTAWLGVLVVNELGSPISKAVVERKEGASVLEAAKTDAKGIYAFDLNSCSPGQTTVEATVGGVSSGSVTVQASTVGTLKDDFKVLVIPQAGVYRQLPKPTISTVELSPGRFFFSVSGSYSASDNVRLYYTLDDSVPAEDSKRYEGIVGYGYSKQAEVTVKAKAFANGWMSSETATLTVTVPAVEEAVKVASAVAVQSASGSLLLRNNRADAESGEPVHSPVGKAGGASMWVAFTPENPGDYTFTATGETDGVDPQLAVYRVTKSGPVTMDALVRVAANDDVNILDYDYSSRVAFTAEAGTSYRIAVDAAGGARGDIGLAWEPGRNDAVEPSETEIFCDTDGGTFSVPVYSTADWKVAYASEWLDLTKSSGRSGESLQLRIPALASGGTARSAIVMLSAAGGSVSGLQVLQSPTRWTRSRAEAMEAALSEGKRVLMVCGRDACSNTTYMRLTACEDARVRPLLGTDYVLWYCNCDEDYDEYDDYTDGLGGYTLPLVCIVDPTDPSAYVARSTGFLSSVALLSFLQENAESSLPTAPSVPNAVGSRTAPAAVALSWMPGRRVNAYEIWRGTEWDESRASVIGQTSGLSFEDDAVEPGTLYWYRVRGVSSLGRSAFSAAVCACAKEAPDGGDQALAEAVGAPQLVWATDGDVPWTVQTTNVWSVGSALQSGAVTSSGMAQTSTLKTTVTGPTRLSFRYLAELNYYGAFTVKVDGTDRLAVGSVDRDWTLAAIEIPAGTHEVSFVFAKTYAGYYDSPTYVCLDDVRLDVVSEAPSFVVPTTDSEGSATRFCGKMSVALNVPSGGTVYYTTDGAEPTASSPVYGGPIPISRSTRIRAVCIQPGHDVSPVLDGLYLERHPAVPGEWTTDVDGVCAAGLTNGNLIVTVLANYETCGYSKAFWAVATDPAFLSWARANGVYLLSADSSLHVDASSARSHFWTLRSSANKTGVVYYPTLVVAAAWLPDQAVGYDIARSGQPIGGVTYAGTVSSLTQGLSAYLTPRPVGQRIQVVFDNSWLSGVGATETYEAGEPFGTISDAVAPDRYRHYAFLGWCKSQWAEMTTENMLSESTIVPYANLTVYARWQYGYAIRFLPGGGSGVMLRQGCLYGDVCNLDACAFFSPSGKRFAGWACSNGRRYDDGMLVFNLAEPGGTVTMTAIWE